MLGFLKLSICRTIFPHQLGEAAVPSQLSNTRCTVLKKHYEEPSTLSYNRICIEWQAHCTKLD